MHFLQHWTAAPITILKENITLPDYVLTDFQSSSVKRLYPPGEFSTIPQAKAAKLLIDQFLGLWTELVAIFTFQRLYGFYILQVYLPAYMSVFMSWISFQLGPKNTPSRTTIGVNSVSLKFATCSRRCRLRIFSHVCDGERRDQRIRQQIARVTFSRLQPL